VPVAAQGVAEIAPEIGNDALGVHAEWGEFGQPGRRSAGFQHFA